MHIFHWGFWWFNYLFALKVNAIVLHERKTRLFHMAWCPLPPRCAFWLRKILQLLFTTKCDDSQNAFWKVRRGLFGKGWYSFETHLQYKTRNNRIWKTRNWFGMWQIRISLLRCQHWGSWLVFGARSWLFKHVHKPAIRHKIPHTRQPNASLRNQG